MPLIKGPNAKTAVGRHENIRREIQAGKPVAQAVAISHSLARDRKKTAKLPKKGKQ